MTLVLAFALILVIAVLLSGLANRTILSTSVIFLVAGLVLGWLAPGVVTGANGNEPVVATFAELALFSVLFTDAMRVGLRELVSARDLPGRALLFGLPLTLVGTALLGHLVLGLPWVESFLLGAVLSPTDPVFAAAIVGRAEVPARLRHLLNVESGLNDGLALPFVVVLLSVAGPEPLNVPSVFSEVALGIVLGVALPWVVIRLEQSRLFGATPLYQPLNAFAIGLLVLAAASLTHANEFLAAFAAGVTVATISDTVRAAFEQFGELVTELLKLMALLVFGALVSHNLGDALSVRGLLFAALAIVAVRPLALWAALPGSSLTRREWIAATWFGPKGFASVVYGLLILRSGIPLADQLFQLTALVVVGSILLHSSTDVIVASWFHESSPPEDSPDGDAAAH